MGTRRSEAQTLSGPVRVTICPKYAEKVWTVVMMTALGFLRAARLGTAGKPHTGNATDCLVQYSRDQHVTRKSLHLVIASIDFSTRWRFSVADFGRSSTLCHMWDEDGGLPPTSAFTVCAVQLNASFRNIRWWIPCRGPRFSGKWLLTGGNEQTLGADDVTDVKSYGPCTDTGCLETCVMSVRASSYSFDYSEI